MGKHDKIAERYAVNFDLDQFVAQRNLAFSAVDRALDISAATGINYRNAKLWPLSAYKAIIAKFGVEGDAVRIEKTLKVTPLKKARFVNETIRDLAKKYDRQRAGVRLAFAGGDGFYTISPTPAAEEKTPAEQEPPPLPPIPADIQQALDEQELLVFLLARATDARDQMALAKVRLEREATALKNENTALEEQARRLQKEANEWRDLTVLAESGDLKTLSKTVSDEVVNRVAQLLGSKGQGHLVQDLRSLVPKKMGAIS